jgi:hypothetical protein
MTDNTAAARDLVLSLEDYVAVLRSDRMWSTALPPDSGRETLLLRWLAWLLPAVERSRFVTEAQGNLGDCERWWQRIDHLVCLALGTPRLAWMMWRENRRGRA